MTARSVKACARLLTMVVGAAGSLVAAAAVTTVGVAPAAAATGGQVVVGDSPITLRQPADPFLGTITPSANAATEGMFGPQIRWPEIPLQAVLMPNGHLVTYGSPIGVAAQRGLAYDDWNPALGGSSAAHVQTPSMHDYDSFCSGMVRLPDGRLIMIGGNSSMSTMIFDPSTAQQSAGPALADQRWYASTLRLADDRILAVGGADYYNTTAYTKPSDNTGIALTPEVGNGTDAWTSLTGAASTTAFGATDNRWWYPRVYNAPDGSVLGVSADQVWSMDTAGTGSIRELGELPTSIGISGSSVLVRPGQLLLAGGGQQTNSDAVTATDQAMIVDVNGGDVAISRTGSMNYRRNFANLTAMANGEVLANGGTVVGTRAGASNVVNRAEIYDPTTGQWRLAATAQRVRSYHSVSLLMPSGAVFTGGGGISGPEDNMNAELYYPPYLFTKGADGKVGWADRPTITSLAGDLSYGGHLSLGLRDDREIRSASLVNLAAVTHSFNADQRYVPLDVTQDGDQVGLDLPQDPNDLPPGSYLLQVQDADGVPSPAQIITVSRDGAGTVTLQQPSQAVGGGESGDTTSVGVVPLTVGTAVSLEPYDQWGYRVRANGTTVSTAASSPSDPFAARLAASFVVRRGFTGTDTISFESRAQPGVFLRVKSGSLVAGPRPTSAADKAAASLRATTGLAGQFTSFRLGDGTYLRRKTTAIKAQRSDGSDGARQLSTFSVRLPMVETPRTRTTRGSVNPPVDQAPRLTLPPTPRVTPNVNKPPVASAGGTGTSCCGDGRSTRGCHC